MSIRNMSRPLHVLIVDDSEEDAIGSLAGGVAHTDDAIANHGVLNSGIAFIQKPFRPEALIRRVREVIDGAERTREPAGDLAD
jgi:DNA-binding response OmpR family regulator